jgi:hypothetical protein
MELRMAKEELQGAVQPEAALVLIRMAEASMVEPMAKVVVQLPDNTAKVELPQLAEKAEAQPEGMAVQLLPGNTVEPVGKREAKLEALTGQALQVGTKPQQAKAQQVAEALPAKLLPEAILQVDKLPEGKQPVAEVQLAEELPVVEAQPVGNPKK